MNDKAKDVYQALKAQLVADATLAAYIKGVDEGARTNSDPEDYPRLALEPQLENETVERINTKRDDYYTVTIFGFTYVTEDKVDAQIYGTGGAKGIGDLLQDVVDAVEADRTIGGKAINIDWIPARYSLEGYPVRTFAWTLRIRHRRTVTL